MDVLTDTTCRSTRYKIPFLHFPAAPAVGKHNKRLIRL
nr:MAG TPA_asm: hypothetical protein [Caudoviricetes sp.]